MLRKLYRDLHESGHAAAPQLSLELPEHLVKPPLKIEAAKSSGGAKALQAQMGVFPSTSTSLKPPRRQTHP